LATEADATLRRQLRLGETGLVISEVQGDKPADKAGVKAGDVLVTVNRKQVAKEEELTGEILRSDGKPVELELVRGGARLKLTVTPAPEDERTPFTEAVIDPTGVHTFQSRELMLVYPEIGAEHKADWARLVRDPASTQPANPPVGERLRQITEQLDQLRQAVDALRNDVNGAQPPKQEAGK
jgi:membrane-associated protease RseP (regulator of RpoE activity)